jgi:hypothetical protein
MGEKFIHYDLFNDVDSVDQRTASVVYWSELLATDPEVPGSIPDATTISEK